MRVSGVEEEFDLSGGLPRLLYVKAPAPDREPRLADLLARIKEESAASYRYFRNPAELGRLVRDDLAVLLSERFAAAGGQAVGAAPPTAGARGPRPLPVSTTSLLGRERAVEEVAGLVERPGVRLVALTGPGGVGKTRLAVAVGERLRDRFSAGTVFVPLETVTDPGRVLAAIGRAAGADLGGTGLPVEALAETFGDGAWLLILDNLEQVAQVAPGLAELLARCPQLAMLATSRTVLGLRAEREYPVPPLPVPADPATVPLEELRSWPAVALFVDRARAVRPGFALTKGNAAAVAEICRRLEGLPLAIELAAARTQLLDPAALLDRLAASLDALGTGAVDLPERQRTLRATVEWSMGLLDDAERLTGSRLEGVSTRGSASRPRCVSRWRPDGHQKSHADGSRSGTDLEPAPGSDLLNRLLARNLPAVARNTRADVRGPVIRDLRISPPVSLAGYSPVAPRDRALGPSIRGKRHGEPGDAARGYPVRGLVRLVDQGRDRAVVGQVPPGERMYAPFAGGLGEQAEEFGGQADVAPARGDRDGDFRGAVLVGGLVAGDRDTALAGGLDGDEREPARVVDGREEIEELGRDPRVAAEEPAADGVGVGGLDRFGQRGRVTGLDGADQDAAPIAQRDQPLVLLRVARRQIRGLRRRAHSPVMSAPAPEVRHSARLPPPVPPAQSRRSLIRAGDLRGPPAANTSAARSC